MKPLLLNMGGSGNIFYQYNFVENRHGKNFFITNILYSKFLMKILKHTINYPNHIHPYKECSLLLLPFYFFIFLIDIFFVKLTKFSFFTYFDSTSIKKKPLFRPIVYFGYFQSKDHEPFNLLFNASKFIKTGKIIDHNNFISIHIRGGDYLAAYSEKNVSTNMPKPYPEWYINAIEELMQHDHEIKNAEIVTDDWSFAMEFHIKLKKSFPSINFYISKKSSFDDDLSKLLNSFYIISYNSTFALMAAESNIYLKKAIFTNYLGSKCLSEALAKKSKFIEL